MTASVQKGGNAMYAAICSTFGYVISFVGVVLLWVYGMPYRVRTGGAPIRTVTTPDTAAAKKMEERYDLFNKIGLGLVFLGTIGQVAGTWLASLPHQ